MSEAASESPDPYEQRQRFAERLRKAGISDQRFIDVHDGAKGTRNHTRHGPDADALEGNYGVYGGLGADSETPEDPEEFLDPDEENTVEGSGWIDPDLIEELWLVDVDVDDYENTGDERTDGLESLPDTFTIESPHTDGVTGGHHYFAVRGHVAAAFIEAGRKPNPSPDWGEVRVYNQMCVGPGSQIQPGGCEVSWCDNCRGCDKEWCDECAKPDGGYYRIADDRDIAVLELNAFVDAILTDLGEDDEAEADADVAAIADAVAGSPDDTGTGIPEYTPDPDAEPEDVLSRKSWMGTYLALGYEAAGLDDRSTSDWRICKDMIKAGVSKDDVRDLLEDREKTKAYERRDDDYFENTWADAIDDVIEECNDEGKPVPWDDDADPEIHTTQFNRWTIHADDFGLDQFADTRPEPIIDEDDQVWLASVNDDRDEITIEPFGQWRCERCGVTTGDQLSRGDNIDDREPHKCPGCEKQGRFTLATPDPEMSPKKVVDPIWYAPANIDADPDGLDTLWSDTREYIKDHWDAGKGKDYIYDGLTAFALSTWIRPSLKFVPHILLIGRFTGGKTRLLNTLARICYRGDVFADVTPAAIFRMIDSYDSTVFISEYHGLGREQQKQLDMTIRAGQKRGEKIPRCVGSDDGDYDVSTYDPFTHIAVASQYKPADDIVSRCLQIHTSKPTDRAIPSMIDDEQAAEIRNRMLVMRFRYLGSEALDAAETGAERSLRSTDIEHRLLEKLLGLTAMADLWDNREAIMPFIDEIEERTKKAETDSEDAKFVEVVRDLAFDAVENTVTSPDTNPFEHVEIPLSDVAEQYERMTGVEKSSAWAGQLRGRHGFQKHRYSDGTVIKDPDLEHKLLELCDSYGLAWEPNEYFDPVIELDADDQFRHKCGECGNLKGVTHKRVDAGYYICGDCVEDVREAVRAELAADSPISADD